MRLGIYHFDLSLFLSIDPGSREGAAVVWSGGEPLHVITWSLLGRQWRSGAARLSEVLATLDRGAIGLQIETVVCEAPIRMRGSNTAISFVLFREIKLWAGKAPFVGVYPATWRSFYRPHHRGSVLRACFKQLWGLQGLNDHQLDALAIGYWHLQTAKGELLDRELRKVNAT